MRKTWDDYFLGLCEKVAEMGTCGRKQAGAIIVNPNTREIVATGFNGSPRGQEHCTEKMLHICSGGCLNDENRCVRSIHAEHNAILQAKQDINGFTLYCTDEPCENCTKYMVQTGIKRVVFSRPYGNKYNQFFNYSLDWECTGE
ncbi:dCMP deaminase [Alteribacillus persepolensis]|uniref:dCMP deaminase n=1 Tax=Alteribacillus persepolensis TaxID=568899 RepID=A0A1G8I906_9BACI|nr:deaminase [Alteribacillus persepolensis]SDI15363.1 dCMP deaminase [Alteribacillus persepolensis]